MLRFSKVPAGASSLAIIPRTPGWALSKVWPSRNLLKNALGRIKTVDPLGIEHQVGVGRVLAKPPKARKAKSQLQRFLREPLTNSRSGQLFSESAGLRPETADQLFHRELSAFLLPRRNVQAWMLW
jgi:hypothetical protein